MNFSNLEFYTEALLQCRKVLAKTLNNKANREKFCPPKITRKLEAYDNGSPKSVSSCMWGRLPTGEFGSKTIYASENTDPMTRRSVTTVFRADGTIMGIVDSAELTPIRCGLMTVDLLQQIFNVNELDIGFVGFGAVNQRIADILNVFLGIDSCTVVTSSGKFTSKQSYALRGYRRVNDTIDFTMLKNCNVISTATTEYRRDYRISKDVVPNTKLLIAWDTGYYLDESFRPDGIVNCDHPEQLAQHPEEFLNDKTPPKKFLGVYESFSMRPLHNVVYMYGVSVIDILVAKIALEMGLIPKVVV